MGDELTLILNLPQETVKVLVEYYNKDEEEKFKRYPTYNAIHNLVETGLEVPIQEFLTYYLFHRKRPGKMGWGSYPDIESHLPKALADLHEWIDFNKVSISTPRDVEEQDRGITEHIGESIGLSVVSAIHELTAADWERIRARNVPSFDYQLASDGTSIIELETKGTSVPDNRRKPSTVSNHRREILAKKRAVSDLENRGSHVYRADLRYGTITVIGQSPATPVRCLLVDPPPEGQTPVARAYRLLLRMRFLRDWISFVSPRSHFATALRTRVHAIDALDDPFALDRVPLLRGSGEEFDVAPHSGAANSPFFESRSTVRDRPAGGTLVWMPDGSLFLVGIQEELLQLCADQRFDDIVAYRARSESFTDTVDCVVTKRTAEKWQLPELIGGSSEYWNEYITFSRSGVIHYSNSGILFGLLPPARKASN